MILKETLEWLKKMNDLPGNYKTYYAIDYSGNMEIITSDQKPSRDKYAHISKNKRYIEKILNR